LLVEYDAEMAAEIKAELENSGYRVRIASLIEAADVARADDAFFLILDRHFSGTDSLQTLALLRKQNVKIPAIVTSVLASPEEVSKGLNAGADDYLAKPFSMVELVARVDALLRRLGDVRATKLKAGDIEMDLIDQTTFLGGIEIRLLPAETKVLEYFLRHPNQVVTRAMLLKEVWRHESEADTNVVETTISNLRRKIDRRGWPSRIANIRRQGFMLRSQA
jgi:two-component system OmpR family response regulator